MEKKIKFAHLIFMISFVCWVIVMAVTPVGGWSLSNPWREYYMNAFSITGAMSFVTLLYCFKVESKYA